MTDDVTCAEHTVDVACWQRRCRMVLYRRHVEHETAKNFQLDLFDPNDGHYEYSAIVTNKSMDGRALWAFMCGRGVHEKVYGELKSGFAFGSVPSMRYAASSAWQCLSVLAFNLSRSFPDPSAHGALSDTTQDNSSVVNLFEYPAIGDIDRDGRLDLSKVGMTLNGLVNLVLVGQNEPFHHVLQAWTGATGAPLPGFPKVIDDYGLTTVPLLVNVGATSDVGDTLNMPELVSGNGLYLVHASTRTGASRPAGRSWPAAGTWGSRRRVTSTTTAWSRSRGGRVDPASEAFTLMLSDDDGTIFNATIPAGQFLANSRGTRLLYRVRTPGLSRVALSSDRNGGLRVRARGRGLDLSGANRPAITTVLGFGPDQFESTNVFRAIGARLRFP